MSIKKFTICFCIFAIVAAIFVPTSNSAKANLLDIYRKEVFDYAVLRNNKPVVVFYTAKQTCALCAGIQEQLEEIAREYNDKIYLAIVDFDKKPELQEAFGIENVPTTRTYVKGKMVGEVKYPVWRAIQFIVQKILK